MTLRLILFIVLTLSSFGPAVSEGTQRAEKLKVFVSILPVAYLVERVGGPHVDVSCMVAPGQDVHTFDPSPQTVAKLEKARAYFTVGLPFEETLQKKVRSTFGGLEFVDTRKGITLRFMTEDEVDDHGHGHSNRHRHKDRHHRET